MTLDMLGLSAVDSMMIAHVFRSVITDVWHWMLQNLNIITVVGGYRLWSMREHRATAKRLDEIGSCIKRNGNGRDENSTEIPKAGVEPHDE